MRRLTALALLVLLVVTMLLTGCSKGSNEKNDVTVTGDNNEVEIRCMPKGDQ